MKTINIGLLGLGTVGAGLVNLIDENAEQIARRSHCKFAIKQCAVRDLNKARECLLSSDCLTSDAFSIINDPDIDIIVELIGGDTTAYELVDKALDNGKHVVTANKALIAKHGQALCAKAQANNVSIAFEAAVAGCIPVLKAVREGLAANQIQSLAGIINGTSNFILTQMAKEQAEFADVLQVAQDLGYAEADPTFDIEGIDAAHKLTILAAMAFGVPLRFDDVYCEGISHITAADIEYITELGYVVKHLAIAEKTSAGTQLRVHPTLLANDHILAHVDGAMNAIFIHANATGPTLYYGAGAGALPTASAVAADLLDVALEQPAYPPLGFQTDSIEDTAFLSLSTTEAAYYLRLQLLDQPGALAAITRILGENNISIEILLQKASDPVSTHLPVVIVTHQASEQDMQDALAQVEALDSVDGNVVSIRKPLI